MRKLLISFAIVTTGVSVGGAASAVATRDSDEAALAGLLAGKTPGKPQACLDTRRYRASLSASGDRLAYRVGKDLVFVNKTTGGCGNVSRGDILVTRSYQSRPCHGDIATTISPTSRMLSGSCALGDFIPYRTK